MLKKVGYHTHKNLQLNSGLLFTELDISAFRDLRDIEKGVNEALISGEKFLGVTRNGVSFIAQPRYREYYCDGEQFNRVACRTIIGWDIKLEVVIVEISSELLNRVLTSSWIDQQLENVKRIELSSVIMDGSIDNLVWIGDMSDGGLILIELRNAVCIGGIRFVSEDNTENGIATRFTPHIGDYYNPVEPPFSIYFISAGKENADE